MSVCYRLLIDRDSDGLFNGADEDLSDAVLTMRWRLGLDAPHTGCATPGEAHITLLNVDGRFSPERFALPPGTPAQIVAQDDAAGQAIPQFTGWVARVEPEPGDQGSRRATLVLQDSLHWLDDAPVPVALPHETDAGEVIALALDAAPLRRAILAGRCLIDDPAALVNGCFINGDPQLPTQIAAGRSTLVGWGLAPATLTPLALIRRAALAERGCFGLDAGGVAIFLNRHDGLLREPVASFSDDMVALRYAYGPTLANRVAVTLLPRSVGQPGSTVWRLNAPLYLDAGARRRLIVRYQDADGRAISVQSPAHPRPGWDYAAAFTPDGLYEMTHRLHVALETIGDSAAALLLENRAPWPVYLTRLVLRGTPLKDDDPLTVQAVHGLSLHRYGPHTLTLRLPGLANAAEAEARARYELALRADPQGIAQTLSTDARHHPGLVHTLGLFDRVTLRETQTGHDADYLIVGAAHEVDRGGTRHRVTWTLETCPRRAAFVLDRHTLDSQQTLLAY